MMKHISMDMNAITSTAIDHRYSSLIMQSLIVGASDINFGVSDLLMNFRDIKLRNRKIFAIYLAY